MMLTKEKSRHDRFAMWGGVLFSLLFTVLIWALGSRLATIDHLPDAGASWYYWQLPEQTLAGRYTAWGFYFAHQLTIWGLIWYAQTYVKKYTDGLHRVNQIALAATAFFVFLHLVQTHIWYDGLAQDVSIFSSQWSVIIMLIWIIIMENQRRGVFFGQKLPFPKRVMQFARKYHGYYFAWAVIYTFWYHPMETTGGHLLGFFYTFLLLLQGTLFFTRIHVNKWWMFVQEIVVLAHGTIVAVVGGQRLWPMFMFGFTGIFIVTQMHGLGLKPIVKNVFYALYIGAVLLVYSNVEGGISRIHEITWIPITDYGVMIVMALVMWLLVKVGDWLPFGKEAPTAN